jgi:hypothetical protein
MHQCEHYEENLRKKHLIIILSILILYPNLILHNPKILFICTTTINTLHLEL